MSVTYPTLTLIILWGKNSQLCFLSIVFSTFFKQLANNALLQSTLLEQQANGIMCISFQNIKHNARSTINTFRGLKVYFIQYCSTFSTHTQKRSIFKQSSYSVINSNILHLYEHCLQWFSCTVF